MSIKGSQSGLIEGAKALWSARDNPAELLQKVPTRTGQKALVGKLVSYLQNPSYSIADLLRDAAEAKKKFVAAGMPVHRLVDGWTQVDRTVEDCLSLTLVPHEKFIDNTLHAFCELDQAGFITFANAKMIEWVPTCVGKELATLFGKKASEVRKALAARGPRRSYQFDLESGKNRYAILAEFGKIKAKGPINGYALLVDMSELVDAEHKALEAAPNGMLKHDSKYRVVYANQRALQLLELTADELVGHDAREFISDQKSRQEVTRQRAERSVGRGGQYDITFTRQKSHEKVRLRITGVPSFNTAGEFSGTLTALQPIDREIAREDIARLTATETDYRILFSSILKIIERFVAFDWADLSLYTEKRDYALSFCRHPEDGHEYPVRWWFVAPIFRTWIDEKCPCMSDMLVDINNMPGGKQALAENPEIELTILSEGRRRALISLPIRREGRVIGVLSLQSKKADQYNAKTFRLLRQHLAVDQALLTVFNLREHADRDFVSGLLLKISASANLQQLAKTIVSEFARFYKFQNVSIFKINTLRGHFSLLAQQLGPNGGSRIPADYTQPLDKGLLGLTYERGECINLKDRKDGSEAAKRFTEVAPETVSELCIPIKLRGRILWILNLEDPLKNAFAEPEIETIKSIVGQVDAMVDHLFGSQVLSQVLEVFPDGVVIAGKEGNVLLCNDEARRLFERERLSTGSKLSSFLSASDLAKALSEQESPAWTTEIHGTKGKKTSVLMKKFLLPEEYDHVVLLLKDVTELQWRTDIERLKAALAEAASQVRVPLSLVSSYVHQIWRKAKEDSRLMDLADKTIRQLSRIELTYDRVFASYDANKLPTERKIPVDVSRIIGHILDELPASDRETVKLTRAEGPIWVLADSYRLLFALESMLSYLLRSRANSNEVSIKLSNLKTNYVEIAMAGSVISIEPNGELETIIEATRTEIALGERLLKRIAGECGGTFARVKQPIDQEELSIRLRLTRY
jgi:PAS domain S-box-containing protein